LPLRKGVLTALPFGCGCRNIVPNMPFCACATIPEL
jgi:hypothetical protein